MSDDEEKELVYEESSGLWIWKTRKEINQDPRIVREDIVDQVLGDDGKRQDTIIAERWVRKKR
ncbi:MAG: hypothetical protein ACFFCW_48065 [Candidatus Hodarchaeota archaeon]